MGIFFLVMFGVIAADLALIHWGIKTSVKVGKRLLGWAKERNLLSGTRVGDPQEAQDVVVETVDELEDVSFEQTRSSRRPPRPEGQPAPARHSSERAAAANPTYQAAPRPSHASRNEYVRLDIDEGTTSETIVDVMNLYVDDRVLGKHAQSVIDTLASADLRRRSIFAELDGTFQRGTISWDRFAAPTNAALDALLNNAALQGNRIQSFDTAGYLRVKDAPAVDWQTEDNKRYQTQQRRLKLFQEMLDTLEAMEETNENLLFELDKLSSELVMISSADQTDKSEPILDEIRRLVEEAKYYR